MKTSTIKATVLNKTRRIIKGKYYAFNFLEPLQSTQSFLACTALQSIRCLTCMNKCLIACSSVKNLKSFGFVPPKGQNKILISSLSKEKIKKLANLRVIQKTLVYVIGIAPEIAHEDILKSLEYFG